MLYYYLKCYSLYLRVEQQNCVLNCEDGSEHASSPVPVVSASLQTWVKAIKGKRRWTGGEFNKEHTPSLEPFPIPEDCPLNDHHLYFHSSKTA